MARQITSISSAVDIIAVGTAISSEMSELSRRAKEEGAAYPKKRFVCNKVTRHLGERIFMALIGPRGAGKSIILQQIHHASESSFYISLDSQKPDSLYDIAKEISDSGIWLLLLDEIHRYPNYAAELKKIYDFLPKIRIVFTSSCAIILHELSHDLSRRVRIVRVPPFSFREFLFFERSQELAPLSWGGLLDLKGSREYYGKTVETESLFEPYLMGRNYPFSLGKTDLLPLFGSMLQTVIEKDLVSSSKISQEESFELRRMLQFIGRAPTEGTSYSSISANAGISRYKAQKYTELLEKSFVLRRIMPKGTNVNKEPKILFSPPYRLLYRQYGECIGDLREDFFADAASRLTGPGETEVPFAYLKSTRGEKVPDYVLNGVVCEIGGRGKGRSQFKGYTAKKKLIFTHPGTLDEMRRPLFFAGMLKEAEDSDQPRNLAKSVTVE